MRTQASLQTGTSPANIRFECGPFGKPFLPPPRPFHFNTSHSGSWVLAAFHDDDIGIDVEHVRPLPDLEAIASGFFSPTEHRAIADTPAEKREDAFFDLWTLKESFIKAIGKGLQMPLDAFSIDRRGDGTVRVTGREADGPWFFRRYAPDPDHKVAVCCRSDTFPRSMETHDVPWLVEHAREAGISAGSGEEAPEGGDGASMETGL